MRAFLIVAFLLAAGVAYHGNQRVSELRAQVGAAEYLAVQAYKEMRAAKGELKRCTGARDL